MERGSHPCPLCDGRGWNINEPSQSMYPCRACGGTGRANERGDGVNEPPADVGDGFWAGPDAHVPGASAAEAGMAIGAADLLFNMATVLELAEENPATVRCYRRMAHALAEGRYPDDDEYVGCGPRLKRVIQTMTDPENQPHQWALRS